MFNANTRTLFASGLIARGIVLTISLSESACNINIVRALNFKL